MAKYQSLTNTLTRSETILGWLWLIFELFFLPALMVMANNWLGRPLEDSWFNVIYFTVNFCAVLILFRRFLGKSVMSLGKNLLGTVRGAFLGFCVYYVSNLALTELLAVLFPWFSNVNDAGVIALLQLDFWPLVIGTVVLVPLTEEILFRGVVFQSLYTKNRFWGYLLSAVIFCAVHVLGYIGAADPLTLALCFIQYIPASVCLAWAYTQADNIFAPILIHTVINAMGIMAVR